MNGHLAILHIITTLDSGGAEAVLYRLITTDRRHTHHVISLMDAGRYGPLLSQAGVAVHALGMPRGKLTVSGIWQLWRLIRKMDVDVVQTWMHHADLLGGVMARLAGKHAVVWGLRNTFVGRARTRFIARACSWTSHIVPRRIISGSRAAAIVHAQLGYTEHKMVIVPNGYDLAQLHRDEEAHKTCRAEWNISPETILLGLVARWDPAKDHTTLAKALQLASASLGHPWRLVLVGPGIVTSNDTLDQLLRHHRIRDSVILLGPRTDITRIMSAIDIHVLSSLAEGFPNVVAEAMACETPCVATDAGDAALIIGDTGWVVPVGDPEALAGAITEAMEQFHEKIGWAARQRAARQRIQTLYSIEAMVQGYSEVWRDAASA